MAEDVDEALKADQLYYEQKVEECRADLFTPRETNKPLAEEALRKLCEAMKIPCADIQWGRNIEDRNDAAAWAYPWGSAGWAVYAAVALERGRLEADPDAAKAIEAWRVLASEVSVIGSLIEDGSVHVMIPRCSDVHLDDEERFHAEDGPAISWPDYKEYYWHGMEVPEWVIMNPTIENIQAEENIEIRRCAIERIGWEEFIVQAHLTPISSDDFGTLYAVGSEWWGEPRTMALVVNGTPERDGTIRRYGLLAPEQMTTALEAVAWSYDIEPEEYAQLERRT